MQKTLKILLWATVLCLFAASLYAQDVAKVFIKTPGGKLVRLNVGGQDAMLGIKLLPTPLNLKVTGSPVVGLVNQLTFTYHDELGRTESNSVLNWYLADDVTGANASIAGSGPSFTPQAIHEGKYLRAGVVCFANTGNGSTVKGDEVYTPWLKVRASFYQNAFAGMGVRHMNINVVNVAFGAGDLQAGDEIAVFDGSICCAHETVAGPVTLSDPNSFISLAASQADNGANGYTPGRPISIRVWRKASSLATDYAASLVFIDPASGDQVTAPVFTEDATVFVKLTVNL